MQLRAHLAPQDVPAALTPRLALLVTMALACPTMPVFSALPTSSQRVVPTHVPPVLMEHSPLLVLEHALPALLAVPPALIPRHAPLVRLVSVCMKDFADCAALTSSQQEASINAQHAPLIVCSVIPPLSVLFAKKITM